MELATGANDSTASIRLADGSLRAAEIHWYEATGIGKLEFKIKRYLDTSF